MPTDKPLRAVAVRYTADLKAPVVIHKGSRLQAEKIIQIAQQHGIIVVQQPHLLEELYSLQIEEIIPETLYESVARLLHFVYTLQGNEKITS
ncbi:MAG: EscU/YscU/HrcU family type III secretion system export apparatus switch protein [Spirochaeta sp.]